ncbi:MAG: hypothetical protein CMH57_00515 [Myxococcales bacterium]|nr:hypothetical protein [Myxococcales bacterium]
MSDETPKRIPRCDLSKLQVGERLSRIQYYEVLEINLEDNVVKLQNEHGFKFTVTPNIIEAEMYTATQYAVEEKVSRTELVEKLESAGETVFAVTFLKQVTDKGIAAKLKDLDPDAVRTDKSRRALARELLKGEERTLVGYLLTAEPKLGRSMVIDLEVPSGKHNIRMVDHRTIQSLVLKNVLYTCT